MRPLVALMLDGDDRRGRGRLVADRVEDHAPYAPPRRPRWSASYATTITANVERLVEVAGMSRLDCPGQGYLFKLPAELVAAFPKLGTAAAQALAVRPAAEPPTKPPMPDELGRSYRPADEDAAISERDPFPTDPAVVERGVRGHARTQNALAVHIATQGFAPLSPAKDDPLYDLLWRDGATLCVAEVKSLTTKNEERQLRLGLGQVLRYRQRLHASSPDVRAHLVTERQPTDPAWQVLCDELDVVLAWPEVLQERL